MANQNSTDQRPGRRTFLKQGTLLLASAATIGPTPLLAVDRRASVTFGLITDLHYADKPPAGSRHYRETPEKLAEAADKFGDSDLDFVVELGDFIDAADAAETELAYLRRINRDFAQIADQRHYVLGNHCVHTLTKEEFLGGVEREHSYYSFDAGDYHFVVLDACFRSDGQPYGRKNFEWTDPNIPDGELEWLQADLRENARQTIVFTHQRLDVSNHYGVKNAAAVRKLLEETGQVAAVFQGHSHQNDLNELNGIHYCTQVAMVEGSGQESNGYATVTLAADGSIEVSGFRRQADYEWPRE